MKRLLTGLLILSACATTPPAQEEKPVNVILFIGDGMGFSQVTLARLVALGPDGKLALDEMPVTGFARTHAGNAWVTDSAAAATTLASGEKTENFAIGLDAKKRHLESLLEQARKKGLSTGLVTTARITHATPAPFAAHTEHRSKEGEIAPQLLGVDVLLGGGKKFFDDGLLETFRKNGYAVVQNAKDLAACDGKVLGLFAKDHIPYVLDRKDEPSLAEMTRKAVAILSQNPKGYFLMVEGGRIDMACHASDAPSSVHELMDMDAAVRAALDIAKADGRTLIVITADHATGGMAITEKCEARRANFAKVTASAEKIEGALKEKDLKTLLKEWAGVEDATEAELEAVAKCKPGYDRAAWIGEIISRRCGVTFIPMGYRLLEPNTTHGHDGAMVPVYAFGPGASRFAGTLDNGDIPKRIRKLAGYP